MKAYEGKKIEINNDGYMRDLMSNAESIKELNRKIYVGAIIDFHGSKAKITRLKGRWRVADI